MLARGVAVSCLTPNASRRVVGQWGGAGGAICEDHLAFGGELLRLRGRAKLAKPFFFHLDARVCAIRVSCKPEMIEKRHLTDDHNLEE